MGKCIAFNINSGDYKVTSQAGKACTQNNQADSYDDRVDCVVRGCGVDLMRICFTPNSSQLSSSLTGSEHGLQMILNIQQHDQMKLSEQEAGVKVGL